MEYNIFSYTTKSSLHIKNEDNHYVCDDYVIIADGMGGECDGDIASQIAVETIVAILTEGMSNIPSEAYIKSISDEAIHGADSKISAYIDRHPDSFGMGTTILLAIRRNGKLFISWCGDSHGYVYKDGKLTSITKDHSYVQQLVDSGHITIEESFTHPNNNLITRFVGGGNETCIPDFCFHQFSESEIIILCSDGLSGYCKPSEIAKTIKNSKCIENLPRQLSELAVQHGSDDDITIVILVPKAYCCTHPTLSMFGWFKKLLNG